MTTPHSWSISPSAMGNPDSHKTARRGILAPSRLTEQMPPWPIYRIVSFETPPKQNYQDISQKLRYEILTYPAGILAALSLAFVSRASKRLRQFRRKNLRRLIDIPPTPQRAADRGHTSNNVTHWEWPVNSRRASTRRHSSCLSSGDAPSSFATVATVSLMQSASTATAIPATICPLRRQCPHSAASGHGHRANRALRFPLSGSLAVLPSLNSSYLMHAGHI